MEADDRIAAVSADGGLPEEPSSASKPRPSYAMVGLFVLGAIAFLRFAQPFLLPVVLAMLLHFLLRPLVVLLERTRLPRPLGAALVLAVFIGALGLGLSSLQEPAREWLGKVPESVRKLEHDFRGIGSRVVPGLTPANNSEAPPPPQNPREDQPKEARWMLRLQDALLSFTALTQTASFLTGCLETIVLLFFLLAAGDGVLRRVVRVLPRQQAKDEAVAIVQEVQRNVSTYLVATAIINACVGLVVALAMRILGLENPLLWGVVAAVLNFIPYFGPLLVFIVLLLAGTFSFDVTSRSFLPALVYLAIHATESNIVTPTALGNRLTLSPLVIFLALMFWTWLWGVPGALLAVPLLMVFRILCEHFKGLRWMGDLLGG